MECATWYYQNNKRTEVVCLLPYTFRLGSTWSVLTFPSVFLEISHKKKLKIRKIKREQRREKGPCFRPLQHPSIPQDTRKPLPRVGQPPPLSIIQLALPFQVPCFILPTTEDLQGCDQVPLLPCSPPERPIRINLPFPCVPAIPANSLAH